MARSIIQLATAFFLCFLVSPSTSLPTVVIDTGFVVGTTTSIPSATATVNKFLGIPFAVTPPERFSPPKKAAQHFKPLVANAFKPACIQQFNFPAAARNFTMTVFNSPAPVESEDCLYLNVFTPSTLPPFGGYPVLFWIYGGALEFGNAGQAAYDGSNFAAFEDVIVVTSNYRSNVFGFPTSPELPITGRNLGFLDQRAALAWVQDNIRSFGGNPDKVTLFGQSAGSQSVDTLVTTFPHNPPFRAAILESGTVNLGDDERPGVNSSLSWSTLVSGLNCSTQNFKSNLACVRAASATTIKSIIENAAILFVPVVDNVTLIGHANAARAAGKVARVPILTGSNGQEGRIFEFGQNNITTFIQANFKAIPTLAAKVAQAYAVGTDGTTNGFQAVAQLYTEFIFQCPQATAANITSAAGIPTWRYYFNATFANTQPALPASLNISLAAFHSSEIGLVFGTYPQAGATAQEFALSEYIRGAWARFARNPTAGPGWNQLGTFGGADLAVLGTNGTAGVTLIEQSVVDSRCALLAPIYAFFNQ